MKPRRILVTGAAGFAGNAFVRLLLEGDPDVEALTYDALTYAGHRVNLEGLPGASRHTFVHGDVADREAVATAFATFEPDALVHFAAETHVDRSIRDPGPFLRTNVTGTQILLEAAREAGIRMVQVSTDEVYGALAGGVSASPDAPLAPRNPYAATKAAGDLLALAAWHTHGQDVLVTRCTNNYGPRQIPEKLIPLMVLRARSGASLPIYGDGLQVRDWIHVRDHAAGVLAALHRGVAGQTYHFAGGAPRTNLQIVRALLDALALPHDRIAHVVDRPGHDRRYALDDATTREALDWAPAIPLEEGLAATVAWYEGHGAWCRAASGPELETFLKANYAGREGDVPPPTVSNP